VISFGVRLFLMVTLIVNLSLVHASDYDDDVLEIFSKILPRFILMSSQKKQIDNDIEICILNDVNDEDVAIALMEKIHNNYPKGIKNYHIGIVHKNYAEIDSCEKAQLIFMFNSNTHNIETSLRYIRAHSILALAYDPKLLQYGAHASLFLGRKVVPYINMKSINESGITFENILLRVSKIYYENEL
jgi:hypothetical protein